MSKFDHHTSWGMIVCCAFSVMCFLSLNAVS